MIDILAIVSGKGGSGKTSLAILLSQLLASSGHKVVLIDCDMSTHGATYFFEEKLNQKEKYYTVSNILYENNNIKQQDFEVLKITSNIGFIPSRVDFPSKKRLEGEISDLKIQFFINKMEKQNYDIAIFDCQAGYSVETEMVTRVSKKNLAVIEADAISAAALRILYVQLAGQLDKGKSYQIFNKITKEEQEIYAKLTHGTIFTNLNPILFDWNVRKAFVTNELPEIDASNPILTTSIYDLALVLFPQYKDDLRKFILGIKQKMITSLEKKLMFIKTSTRRKIFKRILDIAVPFIPLMSMVAVVIITFISILGFKDIDIIGYTDYFTLLAVIFSAMTPILILLFIKKYKDNDYQRKMMELQKEKEDLEEETSKIKAKLNL